MSEYPYEILRHGEVVGGADKLEDAQYGITIMAAEAAQADLENLYRNGAHPHKWYLAQRTSIREAEYTIREGECPDTDSS